MKFTLEIKLGNEAMRKKADVVAALKDAARRVPSPVGNCGRFTLRDVNGNTVGSFGYEDDEA